MSGEGRFGERMRRERVEHLAKEAAHALGERGCFRLRLEDVARGAGVAKGTVYLDFPGKAELLAASLTQSCEQALDLLRSGVEAALDPSSRLSGALAVLARMPVDHPELLPFLEGRLECAARWIGADASAYEQVVSYLADLVEDAAQAGSLEEGVDPDLAAQAILALASTPAWRRLALRGSPERLLCEVAGLTAIFGAEATDP